jgi:hypothetical protein
MAVYCLNKFIFFDQHGCMMSEARMQQKEATNATTPNRPPTTTRSGFLLGCSKQQEDGIIRNK